MQKFHILSILASVCIAAAAETSWLRVPAYNKVKVNGDLNVDCIYCPDSLGYVVVDAPVCGQLPWVEARVSGDKLHLKLAKPDGVTTADNLPRVTIYTNYLTKAENEGDSTLRVLSTPPMPDFEAKLMGNGRVSVRNLNVDKVKASFFAGRGSIVLTGKAQRAVLSIDGAGAIMADELQCEEASVRIIGSGTCGVNASAKLKVSGAGGSVYYLGEPTIKKSMAVGVKIEPIE